MEKKNMVVFIPAVLCLMVTFGCSHSLNVRNLDQFAAPIRLEGATKQVDLGIEAFSGNAEDIWYHNAIAEKLNAQPSIGKIQTDYVAKGSSEGGFKPAYVLSISPHVEYKASGWNFLISWPGFIIFTPAWNGYVYYADINTKVIIYDSDGKEVKQFNIETLYSIRHADFDRTVWSEGLGWLFYSVPAFLSGIFNATSYDSDITNDFRFQIKDNYTNYVIKDILHSVRGK